jgi:hypothetical protein
MRIALTAMCVLLITGTAVPDEALLSGYRGSLMQELIEEMAQEEVEEETMGRRSPALAFFASAAVPGAGQLYMGNWKLAAAFAGLEVLGWVLYLNEDNKGRDLEKDYKRFADDHYVFSGQGMEGYDPDDAWTWGWLEFYEEFLTWPDYPDTFPEIRDDFYEDFRARNSDFYAQIESENRYIYGWEDWNGLEQGPIDEPWKYFVSSFREQYKAMRRRANDKLKRADYVLALPLVLRVVSSTLALNMARAHNASLELTEDVSLNWRLSYPNAEPAARLAFVLRY